MEGSLKITIEKDPDFLTRVIRKTSRSIYENVPCLLISQVEIGECTRIDFESNIKTFDEVVLVSIVQWIPAAIKIVERESLDNNGEVWIPEDSYHKHPCVAVLGRGKKAEEQLYQWLRWFDKNNFKLKITPSKKENFETIEILLGHHINARMVKQCR
jgi:hypothetical protein